jgi:hypothetical protein
MPTFPRPNKKAQEIAFNILGVPENIKSKKTKGEADIDKKLLSQYTKRVK